MEEVILKENMLIINACRWTDKKTSELKAMMSLVFMNEDSIANNDNFFGSNVLNISFPVEKFEILRNLRMQVVEADIDFVNNTNNPLKPKTILKSLKTSDGKVFNLA